MFKNILLEAHNGIATVTVPLTPDHWSSVFGKRGDLDSVTLAGFQDALSHLGNVGLTFGGGCFFSHGAWINGGSARFILTNYQVQ